MKNFILFLIAILFCGQETIAQVNVRFRTNITDTILVDKFEASDSLFSVQFLPMDPGSHHIKNVHRAELLRSETITKVELVYSDYPPGEDMSELNRKRIIELYSYLPEAFNKNFIQWSIVKQTGVKSKAQLGNYFHGFAIYYRPMISYSAENSYISSMLAQNQTPDSTLFKIFERNTDWKDMLVVCDVTGSMSPYTGQLILWLKLNQKYRKMKNILFFNDDDENSTAQVKSEDSTGMWVVSSRNYEEVLDTALKAMQFGSHFENNLEAVCAAIKKFPKDQQKIVMIADNWEDPCDMKLLSYLKKQGIPVRIIVCGVSNQLNMNYVKIAYETGGSIHTMEGDLKSMAQWKDGKTMKIGDIEVKMSRGNFYQVN